MPKIWDLENAMPPLERCKAQGADACNGVKGGMVWPRPWSKQTRETLRGYMNAAGKHPGEFLFASRRSSDRCTTTRQYAQLVSEWIVGIGLDPSPSGTHALRRTKAVHIYRRTANLRAVQLMGHAKVESTVRHHGIGVDDALAIAEQIDV
jgi:integrase